MNSTSLFNLQGPDLIVILLIVLLLFGAKKMPELVRGMGQAVLEFLQALDEFVRRIAVARHERKNTSPDPGTAFGLVAVVVALLFFLLVVGAGWTGR